MFFDVYKSYQTQNWLIKNVVLNVVDYNSMELF